MPDYLEQRTRTYRRSSKRRDYSTEGFVYASIKILDDAPSGSMIETTNGKIFQKEGSHWINDNEESFTSNEIITQSVQVKFAS